MDEGTRRTCTASPVTTSATPTTSQGSGSRHSSHPAAIAVCQHTIPARLRRCDEAGVERFRRVTSATG
jgi:hypothetical protein